MATLGPKAVLNLGRSVVRALLKDLFAAGLVVTLDSGEEFLVERSRNAREVLRLLGTCDEERLIVHDAAGNRAGWVFLVHGNSGYDVISDYSTRLEPYMAGAHRVADSLEDRFFS